VTSDPWQHEDAAEKRRAHQRSTKVIDLKVFDRHILPALRALASKRQYGKGCKRSNCGEVCLCPPCHARVALERMGLL